MQKMLKKETLEVYYFDEKGNKIIGLHDKLSGDVRDIRGDVSGIRGDVTDIRGDVSGLSGDVTGIWGDVNGLRGNVTSIIGTIDECEITDEERKQGIKIEDLIGG